MKVAVLCCLLLPVCFGAKLSKKNPHITHNLQIVNGENAEISDFPWQASLQSSASQSHSCGASIINKRWLVTAAHCLDGRTPSQIQVRIGSTDYSDGGSIFSIDEFTQHEDWETGPGQFPNDIAVMKVSADIEFTSDIKAIALADAESDYAGDTCYITGWGATCSSCSTPNILQKVEVDAFTNDNCNSTGWPGYINAGHICLGREGSDISACFGDSGGPFSCNVDGVEILAGVTSWGSSTCNPSVGPSVYTRVSYFHDWIVENTPI